MSITLLHPVEPVTATRNDWPYTRKQAHTRPPEAGAGAGPPHPESRPRPPRGDDREPFEWYMELETGGNVDVYL